MFEGFEDAADVAYQFNAGDLSYADIRFAFYENEAYEGWAIVIYRDKRDGKFYEVNGSHCSCYGLEDQWSPEEVVPKEIINKATGRPAGGRVMRPILHAIGWLSWIGADVTAWLLEVVPDTDRFSKVQGWAYRLYNNVTRFAFWFDQRYDLGRTRDWAPEKQPT